MKRNGIAGILDSGDKYPDLIRCEKGPLFGHRSRQRDLRQLPAGGVLYDTTNEGKGRLEGLGGA